MATYTPNLNLEKPLQTELYNVDVFNANADKIDAGVGARAKYTDALTLEEIIASTDLTNKVASASAAKSLKESLSTNIVAEIKDCPAISYASGGVVGSYLGYLSVSAAKTGYTPIAATTQTIGHPNAYFVETVLENGNVNFVFHRTNNTGAISYGAGDVKATVVYVKSS